MFFFHFLLFTKKVDCLLCDNSIFNILFRKIMHYFFRSSHTCLFTIQIYTKENVNDKHLHAIFVCTHPTIDICILCIKKNNAQKYHRFISIVISFRFHRIYEDCAFSLNFLGFLLARTVRNFENVLSLIS